MTRLLWLFFVSLVCSVPAHAEDAARVALLIGNQSYDSSVGVLQNPHNDIRIVGAALRQQGFEVLPEVKDARRSSILGAVRQLRDRLNAGGAGSVGFLYYSGHGAAEADTGINYLIPVDAKQPGSVEFWDESLKLDDILKLLDGARGAAKFIVFDACRNELRVPAKSTTKGLSPIAEQQGMLIAYATSPGRTASDQGDKGGPFAAALAAELAKPGLDHLNLFQNVKETVLASTKGSQQPWINDGLARRIQITSPGPAPSPPSTLSYEQQAELAFWNSVKDSRNPAFVKTYLDRFPNGIFANLADALVSQLQTEAQQLAIREKREAELKEAEEARRQAAVKRDEAERKASIAKQAEELQKAQAEARLAQQALAAAERERAEALKSLQEAKRLQQEAAIAAEATAKVTSASGNPDAAAADEQSRRKAIQQELRRVGCDPGTVDGTWGPNSRAALEQFIAASKRNLAIEPSAQTLLALLSTKDRVCPEKPRSAESQTTQAKDKPSKKQEAKDSSCAYWRVCITAYGTSKPTLAEQMCPRPEGCY